MKLLSRNTNKQWLKSLPKRISSSAMILENSIGQVLIVKSGYKPYWTFPGGIIDANETPKEAAIRETLEEVGIVVDPRSVSFVAVVSRHSTYAETYQFIFKAPLLLGGIDKIVLQAEEIEAYELVTRDQVRANDREYGKVIRHWEAEHTGYIEQIFGEKDHA